MTDYGRVGHTPHDPMKIIVGYIYDHIKDKPDYLWDGIVKSIVKGRVDAEEVKEAVREKVREKRREEKLRLSVQSK